MRRKEVEMPKKSIVNHNPECTKCGHDTISIKRPAIEEWSFELIDGKIRLVDCEDTDAEPLKDSHKVECWMCKHSITLKEYKKIIKAQSC